MSTLYAHFCSNSVDRLGSISGKLLRGLISDDSIGVVLRIRFDDYLNVFDLGLDFNETARMDIWSLVEELTKTECEGAFLRITDRNVLETCFCVFVYFLALRVCVNSGTNRMPPSVFSSSSSILLTNLFNLFTPTPPPFCWHLCPLLKMFHVFSMSASSSALIIYLLCLQNPSDCCRGDRWPLYGGDHGSECSSVCAPEEHQEEESPPSLPGDRGEQGSRLKTYCEKGEIAACSMRRWCCQKTANG